MTTKKIVSSRSKRRTAGFSGFKFTENPIAGQNGVWGDFQTKALKIFNQMQYPTMKDEAWRRTDIKNLDGMVKIPLPDAYASSPQIPAKKLDPLVGESQGGQISILPDGMDIFLDQELDEQGVIFTDLITLRLPNQRIKLFCRYLWRSPCIVFFGQLERNWHISHILLFGWKKVPL